MPDPRVKLALRMSDETESTANTRSLRSRRRPYRTPRLERLGTLTEITANVGGSGKNDHAGGPHQPLRKTH